MKKLFTLLLLLPALASFGQRDALYSQYLFNYHVLNPAFSGSLEKVSISIVDRNQWVGIKGAPHTFTVSAHTPVKYDRIGVGAYLYRDQLGPMTDYGFISTYAFRVKCKKGLLSLGLQVGIKKTYIDWDMLFMENMQDIYLMIRPQPQLLPDANFGVYYSSDNFFAGFSSKHLFDRVFMDQGAEGGDNFSTLSRHFYTYIGGFIKITEGFIYKPSVLIKYVDNGDFYFDINSSIQMKKILWLGVSYRSNHHTFVVMGELKLNSKWKIGYSYDSYLGDIKAYNIGSHELKLSYEIDPYRKRRVYHPNYF